MDHSSLGCVIHAVCECKCVCLCVCVCVAAAAACCHGEQKMIRADWISFLPRLYCYKLWPFINTHITSCTVWIYAHLLWNVCTQVEVKPYVLDDQLCDECQGARCGGKFAPFFCANVTCLQYYCEFCWANIHSRAGREFHKPLVKEGADRPRQIHFRWN